MRAAYWLERAWTGPGAPAEGLSVTVDDGRFNRVEPAARPGPDETRLAGLTLPGLANCHSHAFHRALRGRTQRERGTFWTWREQMYAVAGRLDPDSYYHLARATYLEMLACGITAVGEFHYLHHGPDGTPYDDPNAMGLALLQAARDAGIRIALLDTCYLASGIGSPPEGAQRRYDDGDAAAWAERVEDLVAAADQPAGRGDAPAGRACRDHVVGAAIHSVRAVPRDQMPEVAGWATGREAPLHVHLSEQVAENRACQAAYRMSPTEVLADAGVLGERTSAVHATHLTERDVALLGGSATYSCFCPTTERDLGDGIGPSRALHDAGSALTLGSDSHAVIDHFEEMRALELDERLATRERGHWAADELLTAATVHGHRSLGFADAGRIEVGARADLVTVDTSSVRTAGAGGGAEAAVFAASGADVTHVVSGGRVVRSDRAELGRMLAQVIAKLWEV